MILNELKIGTDLRFEREEDNKFDPYAVAIYYGQHKLGFIPRRENYEISKFLELGYSGFFEVRINRLDSEAQPENQVGVIVYIKQHESSVYLRFQCHSVRQAVSITKFIRYEDLDYYAGERF